MSEKTIRVFCVDDDESTTHFYQFALDSEPGMEFAGSLSSTQGIVQALREANPSVLLMDLLIPGCDTLEALDEIRAHFPSLTILMASGLQSSDVVDEVLRRGATGFFLKGMDLMDVTSVIRRAVAGERVIFGRRSVRTHGGSDPGDSRPKS